MKKPNTGYFIYIQDDDTDKETLETVESKVYPFDYQGILLFTFEINKNKWNVTEKSTGKNLAYGKTKSEAKKNAISIIDKKGVSFIKERIKTTLNEMKIETPQEETMWEESLS